CDATPAVSLRAFDPRPLHVLSLNVNYFANQVLTQEALADISQADLDALRQGICAHEVQTLDAPVADCHLTIGMLGGHRALVSEIVSDLPDGGKWLIDNYEVPYAQGYVQVQFGHAEIVQKLIQPELDVIRESVHIDDSAPPAARDAKPGETVPS